MTPDPPPRIAEEAARQLSDSLHVVLPESGHSEWAPGCVGELTERFIDSGTTRDLEADRVDQIRRPAFSLDP